MTIQPNFTILEFDSDIGRIGIKINTLDDEHINFMRTIPGRSYSYATKLNWIPLSSLAVFYSLCNQNEYTYEISEENEKGIQEYLNRGEYLITLDSRRGRIIFNPRDQSVPKLYQNGITTWSIEYDRYTLATSEAYKIPTVLPKYNPKVKFDYSIEVATILEKLAENRKNLLEISQAEDAPDVQDDISFPLRPFQKVAKKFLSHIGYRGILAYDMGLGKTPIAISTLESIPNLSKILIVCPATLKTNWKREIKKATGLDCNVLSGASPSELSILSILSGKHKYHIINYDILGRGDRDKETHTFLSPWAKVINMCQFDAIVMDEAHYIKNVDSGRSKAARELSSKYYIALTGTPVVNRPIEIWPLLNIIDPQSFSSYESFSGQWLWDNGKRVRNESAFREMLSAYMIRRRKEDVIKDLPMIERLDHFIELSSAAKKAYNTALEGVYISLRNPNYEREINSILAQLMRLKQIVADDTAPHSVELAKEIYEETDKKVLIFSQFVQSCHYIHSQLPESLCITGEDSDQSRYEKIDKFQNDPNIKYMVLSTKAGAEGLTLTAAHYVIFNDLCWTPKDHRQAEARCYGRMNDLHSATAYYMQAENTVTETIMGILRQKIALIESTVEGVNTSANENASIIGEFLSSLRMAG